MQIDQEDHSINEKKGERSQKGVSHYEIQKYCCLFSPLQMHHVYVEQHDGQVTNPSIKYSYYAKVFNEEFNLSFSYPKSDTCSICT